MKIRTAARLGGLSLTATLLAATLSGPDAAVAGPDTASPAVPVAADPAYGPLKTYMLLVPAHYETRTRTISTWLSDDPYLTYRLQPGRMRPAS